MTPAELDRRINLAVAEIRGILDVLGEEHVLPSGTIELTRKARREFKREVARIVMIGYTPKDGDQA